MKKYGEAHKDPGIGPRDKNTFGNWCEKKTPEHIYSSHSSKIGINHATC